MWLDDARRDLRAEGPARFWLDWRPETPGVRTAAYALGRFTPEARRRMDRYRVLRVPTGVAWAAAALSVALVPRWLPRAGALPATPWIGAACLHPLPLIAGVGAALTPEVVAHELSHLIWPRLSHSLRGEWPAVLAAREEEDPALAAWLDRCLAGYRDRRSPDECHVRLLEYHGYGRHGLPAALHPFYAGWVEPGP